MFWQLQYIFIFVVSLQVEFTSVFYFHSEVQKQEKLKRNTRGNKKEGSYRK